MKNLLVHVFDEKEKQIAVDILKKSDKRAAASQCYVHGYGTKKDIDELKGHGLIVEELPETNEIKWLEPEEAADGGPTLLSDQPAVANSKLVKLASAQRNVCLIQLQGPMQTEWKTKLEEYDVELLSYKPDFAYKAILRGEPKEVVEDLGYVVRIVDLQPEKNYSFLKLQMAAAKQAKAEQRRQQTADETDDAASDETAPSADAESFVPAGAMELEADESEALPTLTADVDTAGGGAAMPARPQPATVQPAAAEPLDDLGLETFDLKCQTPDQIPILAKGLKGDARVKNVRVGKKRIRFDCDENSSVLKELSAMTQLVSRVDPYIEHTLTNNFARVVIGVENHAPTSSLPWTGNKMIVGVADSGVDQGHPDLANKFKAVVQKAAAVVPNDPQGHGTHVCATIAGSGAASAGLLHGVAKDAKLFVQELLDDDGKLSGLPLDLGDLFQEAYDNGARIHNNSWGVPAQGRYSIDAHEVDEFIYEHPDFLVIFSAGNDGSQAGNDQFVVVAPTGKIMYWSLRSPATSKNALTVGACCSSRKDGPFKDTTWENYPHTPPYTIAPVKDEPVSGDINIMAAFSSRGPCDDDRVKPDLVAPGTVILSALSQNASIGTTYDEKFGGKYTFLSGTSQAAPVVAGAAAIVREYYKEEHDHEPSAALMRATLINGTIWIGSDAALDKEVGEPNFHQGFGRLNLAQTLPLPNDADGFKLLFVDIGRDKPGALNRNIAARAIWQRTVEAKAGLPLRFTLAWTDKPGHGLQQNLDLLVMTPGGERIVGNSQLQRRSFEQWDKDNNIETVFIAKPAAGVYTVLVLAYNTPFEDQGFSLVATGKIISNDFMP